VANGGVFLWNDGRDTSDVFHALLNYPKGFLFSFSMGLTNSGATRNAWYGTRGTLEGDIAPGNITFYRLQADKDSVLRAYIAQGEVLPVATQSFGGIGVFGIPEMNRFYRHVLIQQGYPHHGAVAFGHVGKYIFAVLKILGVETVNFNQPKGMLYPSENPFA
jgi:L-fucose isomerase-like protein